MNCPYCSKEAEFMSSKEFYGRDYKSNLYVCKPCDAYVGTHGKGKTPLGTMANSKVRQMRKAAHSIFDPIWRRGHMSRGASYRWMQEQMGLTAQQAHIGLFNEQQCWELIGKVKKYRGLKQ